ncbi:MAG: CHAD domain-containing protein [Acidimicrobiales bacterium]
MSYQFDPAADVGVEIIRVGTERIDDALERLEGLAGASRFEIEESVHQVRKRCKELRGLLRIVRDPLGPDFRRINDLVRDAGTQLGSIRDAHAVLATFDDLRATVGPDDRRLDIVRAHQETEATAATKSVVAGDPRLDRAGRRLRKARKYLSRISIEDDFASLREGVNLTYRQGRKRLRVVENDATDTSIHELRKAVKNMWYQLRLLEAAAPSLLAPAIDTLDDVAAALGDDHDLAVLAAKLEGDPQAYGGAKAVRRTTRLARAQQADLRRRAGRLAKTIYAERPDQFASRVEAYWSITRRYGVELETGTIAELQRTGR